MNDIKDQPPESPWQRSGSPVPLAPAYNGARSATNKKTNKYNQQTNKLMQELNTTNKQIKQQQKPNKCRKQINAKKTTTKTAPSTQIMESAISLCP